MYNRCVKFGLRIPNRLGKNVRKFQGWGFFLTHTIDESRFPFLVVPETGELRSSRAIVEIVVFWGRHFFFGGGGFHISNRMTGSPSNMCQSLLTINK